MTDDPRLDVRLDGFAGTQPRPVVVAGTRPLSPDSQIFRRDPIVFTPTDIDLPCEVTVAPDGTGTRVDLGRALEMLSDLGINSVLVEGGAGLLAGMLTDGLIERGIVYYGAMLAGGLGTPLFRGPWATLAGAQRVKITSARMVGPDVRVDFSFRPS